MGHANHGANKYGPRKLSTAMRRGHGGRPSPTVVAGGHVPGSDAPWVEVKNHAPNGSKAFDYGLRNRKAKADRPSPTATAADASNASFDERRVGPVPTGYPASLDAELPRGAPAPNGKRLAEFFCCGGGIGLGFRSAGYELAFANDINEVAASTYKRNLGHAPLVRDIRKAGVADVPRASEVDVLTGGFPCVTFSMAGRRMGVEDTVHGKLYLELCRVISEVRPRYFVAENVQGILSANGGAAVKLVLAAFLRLGYRTSYELVNMAEHGVPQTRMRVIFVGVRLDQWRGSFLFPKKTHRLRDDRKAPKHLRPAVTLREAIGDLPEPGESVVAVMHSDSANRRASSGVGGFHNSQPRSADMPSHSQPTSPNVDHVRRRALAVRNDDFHNGWRDGGRPSVAVVSSEPPMLLQGHDPNAAPVVPTFKVTQRVAHGGRRSPTVASGNGGGGALNSQPLVRNHGANDKPVSDGYAMSKRVAHGGRRAPTMVGENNGNVHPLIDGMRRMTVRECARVQSFPDWYEFQGSQADGYGAVGNAVPPLYAKRLALAILDYDLREVIK